MEYEDNLPYRLAEIVSVNKLISKNKDLKKLGFDVSETYENSIPTLAIIIKRYEGPLL